jgi:hypothetical protein
MEKLGEDVIWTSYDTGTIGQAASQKGKLFLQQKPQFLSEFSTFLPGLLNQSYYNLIVIIIV